MDRALTAPDVSTVRLDEKMTTKPVRFQSLYTLYYDSLRW